MAPSLNAIGMTVADMGKTLAFYGRLGLDIPTPVQTGTETEQHVECTLPGGTRLMWDSADLVRTLDPQWSPPQGSPRVSLAFECADPAEVDRMYADLVAEGFDGHREPWDAFWNQRYAMLRDPDGNGVDLYAPLPTS